MSPVELVVGEGLLDARAAGKILRTLGVPFDPARCIDSRRPCSGDGHNCAGRQELHPRDGELYRYALGTVGSIALQPELGARYPHDSSRNVLMNNFDAKNVADAGGLISTA